MYWVMDLNPDQAIEAGILDRKSPVVRLLEWMLRATLRAADVVVVLDRFMKARVQARGIAGEKIAVIPPWALDDHVRYDAEGRSRFRERHRLEDKFVVSYSGNHSPCHPMDALLEAALRLGANPDIHFLFVGGGAEYAKVQRFARERICRT